MRSRHNNVDQGSDLSPDDFDDEGCDLQPKTSQQATAAASQKKSRSRATFLKASKTAAWGSSSSGEVEDGNVPLVSLESQACGARTRKWYQTWWGILLVVLVAAAAIGSVLPKQSSTSQDNSQADIQQKAEDKGTLLVSVDYSKWNKEGSPIGAVATGGSETDSIDLAAGEDSSLESGAGDYSISLDSEYYLMSDGSLAKADKEKNTKIANGQTTSVSMSMETVDYSAVDEPTGEAEIESAAQYITDKGDVAKSAKLKTAALSLLAAAHSSNQDSGTLKIHFIDVGQGDSEFIELPNGKTMLIDAGPTDKGATVVSYIKKLGYDRIDYVVASHPHEDHIGGMPAVLRAFSIGIIYAPKASNNTAAFEDFLDAAQPIGINSAKAGVSLFSQDNLSAQILSPKEGAAYSDLNDYSAVVQLKYNNKVFLFPGDASLDRLKESCSGHVDILKVAHHGSSDATDSSLVSLLTPSFAVISAGAGNSYGLPSQSALKALSSVSVFRTDQSGTIVATCSGDDISFNVPVPQTATAAAAAASSSASSEASGTIVYVTDTGKKYHRAGCRFLQKSQISISLEDAKARGYEPCGVCKPPQ